MGDELSMLESTFSAPAEGRDLTPHPARAQTYRDLEKIFVEALQSHFNLS